VQVQHHAAHASALAGEHPDVERWLVFTWDGVGFGSDGSLWGGEALAGGPGAWQRVASFRPFRLVGGDKAGREPWRSAAALLWADGRALDAEANLYVGANLGRDIQAHAGREQGAGYETGAVSQKAKKRRLSAVAPSLLKVAHQAWRKNIGTHETSAVGRLFDAAAALVLGRGVASFEGQGPMELEHIASGGCEAVPLPLTADETGVLRSDWAPLLGVLTDPTVPPAKRAGIFHESMARALVDQARQIGEHTRYDAVGLSGGVFQNRRLTERVAALLQADGIDVRLHREVPANDGGLSFGQIFEAAARMRNL
jgi:hydrogenase maturation protein HypF